MRHIDTGVYSLWHRHMGEGLPADYQVNWRDHMREEMRRKVFGTYKITGNEELCWRLYTLTVWLRMLTPVFEPDGDFRNQ